MNLMYYLKQNEVYGLLLKAGIIYVNNTFNFSENIGSALFQIGLGIGI